MRAPSLDITDPVAVASALIREPSVTPLAAGTFDLLAAWLEPLGFVVTRRVFSEPGYPDTENFYARRGSASPNLCYAGHVDVVPPGDLSLWQSNPFEPTVRDGMLYGRGAEDMKGGIAAMVSAVARFLKNNPDYPGSLSFLLTADEEGPAVNGTKKMIEFLAAQGEKFDFCIVGEPTNPGVIGEMVKLGRRGSLYGTLTAIGKQGHAAYPERADNPIPQLVAMLHHLENTPIDSGNGYFQPSNLEVTSIDVANDALNVIPSRATARFNIRFNNEHTGQSLQQWVREQCEASGKKFELSMRVTGEPFLSEQSAYSEQMIAAIREVTGREPEISTSGGTSDARFIKDYCPLIEFGLTGGTIHQVDEGVKIADLEKLAAIYEDFLIRVNKR